MHPLPADRGRPRRRAERVVLETGERARLGSGRPAGGRVLRGRRSLRKGDLDVEASLVGGRGEDRRRRRRPPPTRAGGSSCTRTARAARCRSTRRSSRSGASPTATWSSTTRARPGASAGPRRGRQLHAHGPRVHERDEAERSAGRDAGPRGRRPHHGRHDADRVPEGVAVFEDGVTPFALSALKYGLLALLFLFVWRSMRWVIRGLAVEHPVGPAPVGRGSRPAPGTVPSHHPHGASRRRREAPCRPAGRRSTTIGRAPECELRVDDTYASQQHARIFGRNGSWYVEDLGSTNGTFVNEQRLAAPACSRRATGSGSAPPCWSSGDEGRGRRRHRHRPGPRGQRGLVPGRASPLRGRRRHGRTSRRRGRVPARARDRGGAVPRGRGHARGPGPRGEPGGLHAVGVRSQGDRDGHDAHRRAESTATGRTWCTSATPAPTCYAPDRSAASPKTTRS